MFDDDTTIEGKFSEQTLLVKLGVIFVYVAILAFTGFLPVALGVAVVAEGKPPPHWLGYIGPFVILSGFVGIGAWMNSKILQEMSGGHLSAIATLIMFSGVLLGFIMIAAITIAFDKLLELLAVIVAMVVGGALLGNVLINVGKTIARVK